MKRYVSALTPGFGRTHRAKCPEPEGSSAAVCGKLVEERLLLR